jgi:5-methylcytosine-specific restriction endonuclease McrA
MHHNARPLPPYNPDREFRASTGVLVFHDVPEDEWLTAPRSLDPSAWVDSIAGSQARTEKLRRMPYQDYLQTEEWRRLRSLVIGRAGGSCERCRKTAGEWNVHHLTYDRRGHEDLTDLILLCRPCHQAVHGIVDSQHAH